MLRSHALRCPSVVSQHGSTGVAVLNAGRYARWMTRALRPSDISGGFSRAPGPSRGQPWHGGQGQRGWPTLQTRHCLAGPAAENLSELGGDGMEWSVAESGSGLPPRHRPDLHVVLVAPLIPGNVGSIARTCAATAVGLHLVEPLGFQIDDTKLKRAGLDYWPFVVVKVHRSWPHFLDYFHQQASPKRLIAFSKRGSCPHWAIQHRAGDWLLFGAETSGLPAAAVEECTEGPHAGGVARIPIDETYVRSLNLAVAAGVGVYEALRQIDALRPLPPAQQQSSSFPPSSPGAQAS